MIKLKSPSGLARLSIFAVCLWLAPFLCLANPVADALEKMQIDAPKARLPAPSFQINDLTGKPVRLGDYDGRVILLNFWATWCIPCREEMPALQQLWEKFRDHGFTIIAISADSDTAAVEKFVAKTSLTYPVLMDMDNSVQSAYEVMAIPMTYLISHDGKLSGRIMGIRDWASPEAFELIDALLLQKAEE